jgi:hypothetical protein
MTSGEWLADTASVGAMLNHIEATTSYYKNWSRLMALTSVALCEPTRYLLPSTFIKVLDQLEKRADGEDSRDYRRLVSAARDEYHKMRNWFVGTVYAARAVIFSCAFGSLRLIASTVYDALIYSKRIINERHLQIRNDQKQIIRCIFSNPSDYVDSNHFAQYSNSKIRELAKAIYINRSFEDLSILADLIEEQGYTDTRLLGHLRDTTTKHVRGCWPLDFALGIL